MPQALKVTEENVAQLIEFAAERKFRIHPREELQEADEFGESCYCITDGDEASNNRVFSFHWGAGFFDYWKFVTAETDWFAEITEV